MSVVTYLARVLITKDFLTTMVDLTIKLCELNIRAKVIVRQKWPENVALVNAMDGLQSACELFRAIAVPQKEREREQFQPTNGAIPPLENAPAPPPEPPA